MGLDSVELVMEAERLFNIELPDKVVEQIYTFGAFVDCVYSTSLALGRQIDRQEVQQTLRKLVSEQLGITETRIKPESRFIEDLGMN